MAKGKKKSDTQEVRIATPEQDALAYRFSKYFGKRFYQTAGLLFLLAVIFYFFESVIYIVLLTFTAAIFAVAFNHVVEHIPLRRGIATAIVAVVTLLSFFGLLYLGITMLARQISSLVADLPGIIEQLREWEGWLQEQTGIELGLLGDRAQEVLNQILGQGGAVIAGTLGVLEVIALFILVMMGAFFLVADPNRLLVPMMRAVPQERRPAYRRMFERMGERLSGWLIGTILDMIVVGILTSIVFVLLGVPYAILLGVLTGLLSIIPLIGPWIGGVVAVVVTLFHNPGLVIWVIIASIIIQEVEGNFIRPMLMSSAAKVHPFVVLLALLFFSSMFGLLGAILSLPLTLAIVTMIEVLWVEETLDSADDEIEPMVKG